MKLLVFIVLAACLSLRADARGKGCLEYYNNTCVDVCPDGTHRYDSGCRHTFTRRTCENPCPKYMGRICDLSRCDCDGCKVMDERTGCCHFPCDCPRYPEPDPPCDPKPDPPCDPKPDPPCDPKPDPPCRRGARSSATSVAVAKASGNSDACAEAHASSYASTE